MRRIALLVVMIGSCKSQPPPAAPIQGSASDHVATETIAPPALVISRTGLGALGKLEWWKMDETTMAKQIQQELDRIPGIKVEFAVMDVPSTVEREEGYWSVKRGETELVQVLRQSSAEHEEPVAVIVWSRDVATADGTHVGDTVGTVLGKHPDLVCSVDPAGMVAELVAAERQCHSPAEPEITYVLNATKQKLATGKLSARTIASLDIVAIAHHFR